MLTSRRRPAGPRPAACVVSEECADTEPDHGNTPTSAAGPSGAPVIHLLGYENRQRQSRAQQRQDAYRHDQGDVPCRTAPLRLARRFFPLESLTKSGDVSIRDDAGREGEE